MSEPTSPGLPLGNFETPDLDAWRQRVVDRVGKDDALSRLTARREDGGSNPPLATSADASGRNTGMPGAAPYVRGSTAARDPHTPWKIVVLPGGIDPTSMGKDLIEQLEGGAHALWLKLHHASHAADARPDGGLLAPDLETLRAALADIQLDLITIHVDAGPAALAVSHALGLIASEAGIPASALEIHGGLDLLAGLARPHAEDPVRTIAPDHLVRMVADFEAHFPKGRALLVDSGVHHRAGATTVEQLALATAHLVQTLRSGEDAGLELDRVARQIVLRHEVGPDFFEAIAGLRALRGLWTRVLVAAGLEDVPAPLVHATTSARTLTRRDPWVNLIRATSQTASAVIGGADHVTTRGHEEALGASTALGRRTARNLQHVLAMESHLGHVVDAAGGSYHVERLTDELMRGAWTVFQEIEREGGIMAGLVNGTIQERLADSASARGERIAKRKQSIVGVSAFADRDQLLELPESTLAVTDCAVDKAEAPPLPDDIKVALKNGAPFRDLVAPASAIPGGGPPAPLTPVRDAELFEALRDEADRLHAEGIDRRIRLVTVGPAGAARARLGFAEPFFLAGGLDVVTGEDETAPLVCLCGSEEAYEEGLDAAIAAARAAGARQVLLAGPPRDGTGIDAFIHIGADAHAILSDLLATLGGAKS